MRTHRSFTQLRHGCDLCVLEMFHQKQSRDDALQLRQRLNGGIDPSRQLVAKGREIGAIAAGGRMRVSQLLVPETLPVFENVECEVRHDSIDPWTERFSWFEPLDRLIRLHK